MELFQKTTLRTHLRLHHLSPDSLEKGERRLSLQREALDLCEVSLDRQHHSDGQMPVIASYEGSTALDEPRYDCVSETGGRVGDDQDPKLC
jgi:hypothetical protein